MVKIRSITAVFGGDGRIPAALKASAGRIRHYKSPKDGGRGELRRLEKALRSGVIAKVIILTRWNSHSATRYIRRLCRRLKLPVSVYSGRG